MCTMLRLLGWGLLALLPALLGCVDRNKPNDVSDVKAIRLWVAPNQAEERFWTHAVQRWNQSGLGRRVEFTTIPATGGSEEAILTALVAGSGPDLSANIFPGFAAQLANLGQLQDLSGMPGFQDILARRQLKPMMRDLSIAGHDYLMPLYFSPMLIWWRGDILARLGITEVPRTFEDVYELSRRRAEQERGLGMQVLAGREWRSRWYDYIAYYYACSGGAPYILDRQAQYESQASQEALNFIRTMFQNRWTAPDFDTDDPLQRGLVAGAARGAWDISYYQQNHPDTLKHIVIGPMVRSAASQQAHAGKAHTFADSKGIVLFKTSRLQPEALAFLAWVFSSDDISLLWFKETGMPPARGDLMVNPIFSDFYRTNPLAAKYAAHVAVGVPTAAIEETIDVNKIMSAQMVEPMLFDSRPVPQVAAEAARATTALLRRSQ